MKLIHSIKRKYFFINGYLHSKFSWNVRPRKVSKSKAFRSEFMRGFAFQNIKYNKDEYKPCVTLGWDRNPTLQLEDGMIYPRSAENIFNKKYYPKGIKGEWPCDPETGEKLPIAKL